MFEAFELLQYFMNYFIGISKLPEEAVFHQVVIPSIFGNTTQK